VGNDCEIVVIDPYALDNKIPGRVTYIAEKATVGVVDLVKRLAK
jgi:hypothetical protein